MTKAPENVQWDLLYSSSNLPLQDMAMGGVDRYGETLAGLRGDDPDVYPGGFEIVPSRVLMASMALRGDEAVNRPEELPFASAVHQAWAPESEVPRSVQTLNETSHLLGGVPSVVYPDQMQDGGLLDYRPYGLTDPAARITPEAMAACAPSGEFREFHNSMWSRGIYGVVVDPYELMRSAVDDPGRRLDAMKIMDAIEATGTNVARIHVSAGREDTRYEHDRLRSRQELAALLRGPEALELTALGDLVLAAYDIWAGQVVNPILPKARLEERSQTVYQIVEDSQGLEAPATLAKINADPIERQFGEESRYRDSFYTRYRKLPVTVAVPYAGLAQHRGGELSYADFLAMHRDIAYSVHGLLASVS